MTSDFVHPQIVAIRERCKKLDIGIPQLWKALGISTVTYSTWLMTGVSQSFENKIADYLGCDRSEFRKDILDPIFEDPDQIVTVSLFKNGERIFITSRKVMNAALSDGWVIIPD